jgi:hypothetical protein
VLERNCDGSEKPRGDGCVLLVGEECGVVVVLLQRVPVGDDPLEHCIVFESTVHPIVAAASVPAAQRGGLLDDGDDTGRGAFLEELPQHKRVGHPGFPTVRHGGSAGPCAPDRTRHLLAELLAGLVSLEPVHHHRFERIHQHLVVYPIAVVVATATGSAKLTSTGYNLVHRSSERGLKRILRAPQEIEGV